MTLVLMVAGVRSGSGKTTLVMALLAAYRRRGVRVRAVKAGPDYIDPAFHAAACGMPCPNLDSWAMPGALLDAVLADAAGDAELLIIEAAMGLFDGVDGAPGACGRAADLAARYGIPVLLVLDVSGQSQSAAAVARGFALHDAQVRMVGVVLNRVGSERHRKAAAGAIEAVGIRVFGAVPREQEIALPARHLGLVQAEEQSDVLPRTLDRLADQAEMGLDLDGLMGVAEVLPRLGGGVVALPPPGQRVAVARDIAFGFLYPHVLQGWRAGGAEVVFFSPLADEAPPDDADACWLPGGYPELHGETLAEAACFRRGMRRFAETRPVHGECGGYMVLGRALVDAAGRAHRMLDLLDHVSSFAMRRLHLGYRQAEMLADGPLGPRGGLLRGHEFHYAQLSEPGQDSPFAALSDATGTALGMAGGRRGWVSGSFFHVMAQR